MYEHVSSPPPPNKPFAWLAAAAASLVAGVIIYAVGRPYAPEVMHTALLQLGVSAQILPSFTLPFVYQLPSFFHMLALLLATVALTPPRSRLRVSALLVTVLLGITMEFVQHSAVKNTLQACTDTPLCSWLSVVTDYALAGTFDRLDLVAIILAACTTCLLLWQQRPRLPAHFRTTKD